MMRRFFVLAAVFLQGVLVASPQSRVVFEANPEHVANLAAEYKLTIDRRVENRSIYGAVTNNSSSIKDLLAADPKILAVEDDADAGVAEKQASLASATPETVNNAALNRTMVSYYGATVRAAYVQQPAATLIRVAEAQLSARGGGLIAIIDTGVDPTHAALAGSLVPGYDFTRDSEYVSELLDLDPFSSAALTQSTVAFLDTFAAKLNQSTVAFLDQSTVAFLDTHGLPAAFGHGTMVAGIVHLVAPAAKIMPLKAFRADGTSRVSDIVRAIYYAVDHGATAINMSFSLSSKSAEISKALEYAASRNVTCIASAGNMGKAVKLYPAASGSVIGVGSTNTLDDRSPFSNYDSSARIAAPGEGLITTFPGNHYAAAWGTSFSTALVTGAVDVLRQAKPGATVSKIKDALDHGVKIEQKMGDARLDIVRSLEYLLDD